MAGFRGAMRTPYFCELPFRGMRSGSLLAPSRYRAVVAELDHVAFESGRRELKTQVSLQCRHAELMDQSTLAGAKRRCEHVVTVEVQDLSPRASRQPTGIRRLPVTPVWICVPLRAIRLSILHLSNGNRPVPHLWWSCRTELAHHPDTSIRPNATWNDGRFHLDTADLPQKGVWPWR